MFSCAGNYKPESFPGHLESLMDWKYRRGITEWICSFLLLCGLRWLLWNCKYQEPRQRGEKSGTTAVSPCYSFARPWSCQGICKDVSFPKSKNRSQGGRGEPCPAYNQTSAHRYSLGLEKGLRFPGGSITLPAPAGVPWHWQSPSLTRVRHVWAEAVNPSGGTHPLTASDEFSNGPVMAAALLGGLAPAQQLPRRRAAGLPRSLGGAPLQVCAISLTPESCTFTPWGVREVCLSTTRLGTRVFSLRECINHFSGLTLCGRSSCKWCFAFPDCRTEWELYN